MFLWSLDLLYIALGLVLLIWSADRFLVGAASTARLLGVSPFLIGLTVVSLGTSAPEIVVAFMAALNQTPEVAIGNALGSNIANIGMVLGITALLKVLPFPTSVLKSELPLLLGVTILACICLFDAHLSRTDSAFLLAAFLFVLWQIARRQRLEGDIAPSEADRSDIKILPTGKSAWYFASGLAVLLLSAQLLIWAATSYAEALGVSDLIIGLTIVAVGTSLPELATAIGGSIKGQSGLAIGNVVGSNILNVVTVLAIPGLIAPGEIPEAAFRRDFVVMFSMTILLAVFAYGFSSKPSINRFEGLILLVSWIAYNVLLYTTIAKPG